MELIKVIFGGILWVAIYCLVIFVHETGHWLAFRIFGYNNVKLKLNILGDLEIGRNLHHKVVLSQALVISIAGILAGTFPLFFLKFFFEPNLLLLTVYIYLYGCSGDISFISSVIYSKVKLNITLYDFNFIQWQEYKKSIIEAKKSDGLS